MRNFKKFLALVLAMLMVSACAVSVAAFDDVAATDDYAEAVELLANLGVIKGRNDGTNNFYPNDTLTREEAAVIAAKILAGAKAVEWTAATTRFADVVDAWSFAFINYVDTENVMVGNANGEFNPKGTLQIDEAIKIALAIADTKAAFNASVEQAKNPTMAWWTFYVQAANEIGLTDDIGAIRNYQAKCTRGMFAQLIYNAFELKDADDEYVNDLKENFGYDAVEKEYVDFNGDNNVVTVAEYQFTATLFNDALKAAGYTETAADLEAQKKQVSMSWFMVDNATKIASIEVLTTGKVVIYSDAEVKLANAYKDVNGDGKVEIKDEEIDHEYIIINDVKYKVGAVDSVTTNSIMGGADVVTVGIDVKLNNTTVKAGELAKLPEFFKAFLYDDNGDGDYERCEIVEYAIATVSKAAATEADKADQYTVNYVGGASVGVNKDAKTAAKFSGLEVVADGETPMLIQVGVAADCTVDVIEVAELKSGYVLGKTATSVKVRNAEDEIEIYAFNAKHVGFDSKYLEQTAKFYTIAGKYVSVASASTDEVTLMVESVKIDANGNAEVTGYNIKNQFAKTEITVIGVVKNTKLNPVGAFRPVDEETKLAGKVYLAAKELTDAEIEDEKYEVEFEDGTYYTFVKASKGWYVTPADEYKTIDGIATLTDNLHKFSVTEKYVKYAASAEGTAVAKHNVDKPAVVISMIDKKAGAKDVYDEVKYSVTTSLSELTSVAARIQLDDKGNVKVVYIQKSSIGGSDIIDNPLTTSKTIVQVIEAAHEFGYEADVYKAVDLINNKVVNVTGNAIVGSYYVADTAEYKLVDDATIDGDWVFNDNFSKIKVEKSGILNSIYAYATQMELDLKDGTDYEPSLVRTNGEVKYKEYGVDQIKIYVGDGANNIIQLKSDGTPDTLDVAAFANRTELKKGDNKVANFNVAPDYAYEYDKTVDYGVEHRKVTFQAVDTYVVGDTMIIVLDELDEVKSTTYNKLPEGTIVKVLKKTSADDAKEFTYEAFDLAGKIVEVKSEKALTVNNFYIAKDGVVADATETTWMSKTHTINLVDEKYEAKAVYFVDKERTVTDTAVKYTADQITVYEVKDGSFKTLDTAEFIGNGGTFSDAYGVKDQIIIVK